MPRTDERWIEYQPLDQLQPAPVNPKRHDIATLKASMVRFGITGPIAMVDERTGRMVAGHGRRQALLDHRDEGTRPRQIKGLGVGPDGEWLVPVARGWRSRNNAEAEAELLSDNHSGEAGGWEPTELAAALARLGPTGLTGTGYTLADLHGQPAAAPDPDDQDDTEPREPALKICEPGDLWQIGPHRLLVGDSRDPTHVDRLLDGATIHLAATSPPYADRRKYDQTSGFKPIHPNSYVKWFAPVAEIVAAHLAEDGSWCVNIKAGANGLDRELYVMDLVLAHVREWGWHMADEFCWRRNGVPKQPVQRLKNQFEPVYQFTRGRWKFCPDHVMHETDAAIAPWGPGRGNTSWADPDSAVVSQGQRGDLFAGQRGPKKVGRGDTSWAGRQGDVGAIPSDVEIEAGMAYPGNLLPTYAGTHEAVGHPAAYPVGLPAFFTQLLTDEGDNVYDPFSGSGSTIIAAHQTSRTGYGTELSPGYCDEALARIIRHTDLTPTRHDGTEYPR